MEPFTGHATPTSAWGDPWITEEETVAVEERDLNAAETAFRERARHIVETYSVSFNHYGNLLERGRGGGER
jgi:hypothetical protein